MDWATTVFDWIPLIGGWAFGAQIAVIWVVLLPVFCLTLFAAEEAETKLRRVVSGVLATSAALLGLITLPLIGLAAVAAATAPAPPVPAQTTPIAGAENMDQEVVHIRGEGNRKATLVFYGQRDNDSFEIHGYRARIEGGEASEGALWSLSLTRGYRSREVGISSLEPIRSDGTWQWGQADQRGSFSLGQTYELSFEFGGDVTTYRVDVVMPVSF